MDEDQIRSITDAAEQLVINSMTEEDQVAMAIALSLSENAMLV